MKKLISIFLVVLICFSGCAGNSVLPTEDDNTTVLSENNSISPAATETTESSTEDVPSTVEGKTETSGTLVGTLEFKETTPDYASLNDPELLKYVEDNIYRNLVNSINSADYLIENVNAVYLSDEYIEQLEYNSKTNIYFGYSLAELDEQFQGTRYVFTNSEEGDTIVVPLEEYDDTYEQVIKNVAIGTGVILVCVTVSAVSAGVGAPAVAMIFAASAKTGTAMALSSGTIGALAAGITTGIKTKDFEEAKKAALLAGSKGFKWGAISGAVAGGATELISLQGATLNGLTMNEAAAIQKESGFPLDVISEFKNVEQYRICKEAGLTPQMVSGKTALIRDIDLNFVDEATGLTNLQRMKQGLAALDPTTGSPFQLHHIGQKPDSTLAILTEAEHMQNGNNSIWHIIGKASEIDRPEFKVIREQFWQNLAEAFSPIT